MDRKLKGITNIKVYRSCYSAFKLSIYFCPTFIFKNKTISISVTLFIMTMLIILTTSCKK